jgi:hypothetical protein
MRVANSLLPIVKSRTAYNIAARQTQPASARWLTLDSDIATTSKIQATASLKEAAPMHNIPTDVFCSPLSLIMHARMGKAFVVHPSSSSSSSSSS